MGNVHTWRRKKYLPPNLIETKNIKIGYFHDILWKKTLASKPGQIMRIAHTSEYCQRGEP